MSGDQSRDANQLRGGISAVSTSEAALAPITSIVQAIGNTPLIDLEGVLVKLEFMNPSGSVKARLAYHLIRRAEEEGLLLVGDTIVEASSGNTGNALSMVAAALGYKMLVVLPGGMSAERARMSRAFGASVLEVGDFHVNAALATARELGAQPGFFAPEQFENEWNVEENRDWLGAELVAQLPPDRVPDAFVCGVGTGGTLIGVGLALRELNPNVRIVAVEPEESTTILSGTVAVHAIEGISDGFIPGIYARHRDLVDDVVTVSSSDALEEMRRLARDHGLFVGPSSGCHMYAAKQLAEAGAANIVTVFSDEGEKYLSTHFATG